MAWGKAGSTTLTSSGDTITVSDLSVNKFNIFLCNSLGTGGNVDQSWQFNDNTNSVYAYRRSSDGGTDGTTVSTNRIHVADSGANPVFSVVYAVSITGEEKLVISYAVEASSAGAGNAPTREEVVGKFVPSPDADITRVDCDNRSGGSFDTSSNLSALGSDLTPVAAIPFPANVQVGSRAEITDTRKIYHYTYDWFLEGTTIPPQPSTRGLFAGGEVSTNVIDYITIATTGNATDFGDLTVGRHNISAVSSGTRAVFMGGKEGSILNVMDYVTVATLANAIDFGDLITANNTGAGVSSETRGISGGGYTTTYNNAMEYITINTTGNATDFGNLTSARHSPAGVSSGTRGCWGGGFTGANVNTIDYVTIATTGNAIDFGDLTVARRSGAGCGSTTRGIFGGGYASSHVNTIDYITIATTGNATDFGDLTRSNNVLGACSSGTRGVWGGGNNTNVNTIDYVTIDTTGDATDFGDLTAGRAGIVGTDGY